MTESPGPLIDAAWLEARLGADDLVVADVRWVAGEGAAAGRARFEAGHIPGAAYLGIDDALAAPAFDGPGRHPLPSPQAFASTMEPAGIGDGTLVVAYDDAAGTLAARLWWMLDVVGERVALLDGGLAAWGGPLETGPPAPRSPARFTVRRGPSMPWPTRATSRARSPRVTRSCSTPGLPSGTGERSNRWIRWPATSLGHAARPG